jgi:chromosome segregation ATPase
MVLSPPAPPASTFNTIDLAARRERMEARSFVDSKTGTELRGRADAIPAALSSASVRFGTAAGHGAGGAEASLKQAESLRIADNRIRDLEEEIEGLRRENERLASAGDALRRRADELAARGETLESQARETAKARDEEARVFRSQFSAKEREAAEGRAKIEELEHRLSVKFNNIRVRERQLEHRLEIMKMENATLASAKDKMILDLRRQIDQLAHESENAKGKSQELFNQFRAKQDVVRRVVRALRLALTMLEGEDDSSNKPET